MMNMTAFADARHQPFTLKSEGDGAVVLVHGFPGTPDEMRPLAEAVHAAGWTAIVPLLPGFGAQIETLPERRHTEWIACVRETVQEAKRNYQRVVLLGFSMGGAVALHATCETAADALVLINPLSRLESPLFQLLPVLKHVFPRVRPFRLIKLDFSNPDTRKSIAQFMPGIDLDDPTAQAAIRDFAIPVKMFDELRQVGESAYTRSPQVRLPTLVVQSQQDSTVSPAATRRLVAKLPPGVRFCEVAGEHMVIKPEQDSWLEIKSIVIEFINTVNP
jgi:carboxylesterase